MVAQKLSTGRCKACFIRRRDMIYLPCGHVQTCEPCAENRTRCEKCDARATYRKATELEMHYDKIRILFFGIMCYGPLNVFLYDAGALTWIYTKGYVYLEAYWYYFRILLAAFILYILYLIRIDQMVLISVDFLTKIFLAILEYLKSTFLAIPKLAADVYKYIYSTVVVTKTVVKKKTKPNIPNNIDREILRREVIQKQEEKPSKASKADKKVNIHISEYDVII